MYSVKQSIAHLDKNYARVKQARAQNKRINQCYMQIFDVYETHYANLQEFTPIVNQIFNMKNNVNQLNIALKQFVSLGEEVNTLIDDLSDSKKLEVKLKLNF